MNNITLKCVEWPFLSLQNLICSLLVRINTKFGGINSDAFCKVMEKLSQQPYMIVGASYLTIFLSMSSDVWALQGLMLAILHLGVKNWPSVTSLIGSYD